MEELFNVIYSMKYVASFNSKDTDARYLQIIPWTRILCQIQANAKYDFVIKKLIVSTCDFNP